MNTRHTIPTIVLCTLVGFALSAGAQVTASTPYTVSTFATSVLGVYFQPDSIAVLHNHIYIGFGNNAPQTVLTARAAPLLNTIAMAT